ncbi:MAG: hypothetical protein KGJ60_03675 [Verrucomicrobiota bacterium]|nr:hypothetical protein [Verrucomicrobiota bacterium]
MKTSSLIVVLLGSIVGGSQVYVAGANTAPTSSGGIVSYQIGGQGANHRIWLKIVRTTDANGNTVLTTNKAFVEVATGLNYLGTNGQYLPSKEEIIAYPGGAAAQLGEHRVIFANNINSIGAIDLQMPQTNGAPGGSEMKSDILGLAYYDPASGQSVLIAQVQDSQGQIISSNEVVYGDCFQGLKANVVYKYTRAGLSQDVVLLEQPPSPQSLGLSSTSCVLQVLTEFTEAPTPVIQTAPGSGSNGQLPDATVLDFGTMRMIRGRAFLLGTNAPAAPVAKQWLMVSNRTVLIESVRLSAISKFMSKLPAFSQATLKPANGSPLYAVSSTRLLPSPRTARVRTGKMELAKASQPAKGFVLDYIVVNNETPSVFQSGTTYFISGPIYAYGSVTLQGGAILKYPNNTTAFIEINSGVPFTCQAGPYDPAVFTAGDDESVGDDVSGAMTDFTGTIQPGGYADPALRFDENVSLPYVRISYAKEAISVAGSATVTVQDSQIVNCIRGINLDAYGYANLNNCLFTSAGIGSGYPDGVPLAGGDTGGQFYLQYCTIDNANEDYLMGSGDDGSGPGSLFAVNSIFANVTDNFNGESVDGVENGFWNTSNTFGTTSLTDSNNPFVTAGGGNYYLNNASAFIGAATGWDFTISAQQTTEAPVQYNNQSSIGPQGFGGDSNLGYHYDVVDCLFDQSQISSGLTIGAGTIAAWSGQGMSVAGSVDFSGTAQNPCYFIPGNMVQEQSPSGTGITGQGGSVSAAITGFLALDAETTFCDASALTVDANDCEFVNGQLGGNVGDPSGGLSLSLVNNCLLDSCSIIFNTIATSPSCSLSIQQCHMNNGELWLTRYNSSQLWTINIQNTAFDGTSIALMDPYGNGNNITCDYNAYLDGSTELAYPGTHDAVVPGSFYYSLSSLPAQVSGDETIPIQIGSATPATTPFVIYVGGVEANATVQDVNGNWQFEWDTFNFPNGQYEVTLGFPYDEAGDIAYSASVGVTVDNPITTDQDHRWFTDQLNVNATVNNGATTYKIVVTDAGTGNTLTTLSGNVVSGQFQTSYSLNNNGPVNCAFYLPSSASAPAVTVPYFYVAHISSTAFVVAWADSEVDANYWSDMMLNGVVNILDSLSNLYGPDYKLLPNGGSGNVNNPPNSAFEWEDNAGDTQTLQESLEQGGNFFYMGHGGPDSIGPTPDSSGYWLGAGDVATLLGNTLQNRKMMDPYRLVILNCCHGWSRAWANAFGVAFHPGGSPYGVVDYQLMHTDPRAFVAWDMNLPIEPTGPIWYNYSSSQQAQAEAQQYEAGLQLLMQDWQGGTELQNCLNDYANYMISKAYYGYDAWYICGCRDLTRSGP